VEGASFFSEKNVFSEDKFKLYFSCGNSNRGFQNNCLLINRKLTEDTPTKTQ